MDMKRILIVGLFFFVLPGIVLWITRKRAESVENYMVAGRSVGPVATALTAISAATSAGLFVGGAGMAYKFGWGGATWQLGAFIGSFFTWLVVAPRIRQVSRNLNVMTVPELFAKRYGSDKFYMSAAFWIVIFTIPMLVVQLRSGALMMEAYMKIPYFWSLVIMSLALIGFTTLGGSVAISYLSTVQALVMIGGTLVSVAVGLSLVHGIGGMDASLARQSPSLVAFIGDVPRSLWYNLSVVYLFGFFSSPHVVARYYSMKDGNTARWSFPIAMVVAILWTVVAVLIGLFVRALGHDLKNPDMAFATFATEVVPPFVGILLVLVLLGAIFTTLDTLLMAGGTSVVHDLIERSRGKPLEEKVKLRYSKIVMVVLGLVAFGLCLLQLPLISIINAFAFGAFIMVLGVPLVFGIFWDKMNREAALFCTTLAPVLYILWRLYLVKPTGLGEIPGTLLVIVPICILWSILKPATREEYFARYAEKVSGSSQGGH
jgi:SSS family transporter